jgi:hypothetical protein
MRVVAEVGHLKFEAVEGGVPLEGSAQGATAVSGFTELELELEFEVGVFFLAHEPGSAGLRSLEDAVAHSPYGSIGTGFADIVPGADNPAFRGTVLGEKGSPFGFGGVCGEPADGENPVWDEESEAGSGFHGDSEHRIGVEVKQEFDFGR